MDWTLAIDRNLASLRQIAATLVAIVGLDPRQPAATLPRQLHSAVLRILRPAEAALRRLIVMAARDMVVTLTPAERARLARPVPPPPASRTGIFRNGRPATQGEPSRLLHTPSMVAPSGPGGSARARPPAFALFDPLKRFGAVRQGPSQWVPRILFDLDAAAAAALPIRPATSPDDPVSAGRLGARLSALTTALDDLPAQARRLARWRARRALRLGRPGRLSPLRPGPPPGHRQVPGHTVDEVLARCHGLAIDAVIRRDTS